LSPAAALTWSAVGLLIDLSSALSHRSVIFLAPGATPAVICPRCWCCRSPARWT